MLRAQPGALSSPVSLRGQDGDALAIKNNVPAQAEARCEERPLGTRSGQGPRQLPFSRAEPSALQGAELLPGRGSQRTPPPAACLPTQSGPEQAPPLPPWPELLKQGLLVCTETKAQEQAVCPLLFFLLWPLGDPQSLWGLACLSQSHMSCFFPS